ncbi:MAG: antitoxin Xre/MbcA/ParS toxin-binding domain-containing protein [Candidatus Aminicenantaceae bacterium]
MELQGMIEVLGGERTFHRSLRNRIDLIELGKIGLTKAALLHLADYLDLTLSQMADLLPITERTIQRYSEDQHFSPSVSEHILQIAECTAVGIKVFEEKGKFLAWLRHPNRALGQQTPMCLLNSRFGSEMVLDVLGRIEYGVFS